MSQIGHGGKVAPANPRLGGRGISLALQRRAAIQAALRRGNTMDGIEPGQYGCLVPFKQRYGNFIGGEWVEPASGEYFSNTTPITGKHICEVPRSNAADIERALDAAHAAKRDWGRTAVATR